MSGVGSYTTASVVKAAATAFGYDETDPGVLATFDDVLFSIACSIIDAALLVAHGRKTIHPEDFASLAKLHAMFSTPRSSRRHQVGGTSNTGSYYSPGDTIDQTAYMYEGDPSAGGHGGSTTTDDLARTGLSYHSIGGAGSKIRNRGWVLPSEGVTRILREYRLRFNTDLRMTDAAKLYMRATLQSNMDALLQEVSKNKSKSKSKSMGRSRFRRVLTSSALRRASESHVLVLVLA